MVLRLPKYVCCGVSEQKLLEAEFLWAGILKRNQVSSTLFNASKVCFSLHMGHAQPVYCNAGWIGNGFTPIQWVRGMKAAEEDNLASAPHTSVEGLERVHVGLF